TIAAELGAVPVAFSYPEGDLGQESGSNSTEAVPANLHFCGSAFDMCFIQGLGINVRTQDPTLFTRIQPSPRWSGDELIRYLQNQDPFVQAFQQLFRQALSQGHLHE